MFESFLEHLKEHLPDIPDGDRTAILSSITIREFPKKSILWKQGARVPEVGYVHKGCFRYYTMGETGTERTTMFALEKYWIGDLNSVLNNEPAKQSLESLEDSTVLCFKRSSFKSLMEDCASFRDFTNLKRIKAYDASIKRVLDLSEPAEIRYTHFLEKYPNALLRIPLYHVASYLGITPESLSRIRKKITHGSAG